MIYIIYKDFHLNLPINPAAPLPQRLEKLKLICCSTNGNEVHTSVVILVLEVCPIGNSADVYFIISFYYYYFLCFHVKAFIWTVYRIMYVCKTKAVPTACTLVFIVDLYSLMYIGGINCLIII